MHADACITASPMYLQVVSRLMLDLSAICTALAPTDPAWLVGFLQRRRSQRLLVQHIGYHLPPLAPTAANVQAVLGPGEGAVAAGTVPAPDAVLSTSPDPGFEEAAQGLGPSSPTESGAASRGKGTPEPGADGDAPTSGSLAFLSPVGSPMLMSLLSNMVASPSSNQVGGGGSEPGGMQMGPLVMVAAANPAVLSSKQLLVNVLRGALKVGWVWSRTQTTRQPAALRCGGSCIVSAVLITSPAPAYCFFTTPG
jgi:hypothetical protein